MSVCTCACLPAAAERSLSRERGRWSVRAVVCDGALSVCTFTRTRWGGGVLDPGVTVQSEGHAPLCAAIQASPSS